MDKNMKKPVIIENTIKVPSSEDYLTDIDSFLEGILRGYGLEETVIADIAICVTELAINGIIHGNKADIDKNVTIEIKRHESSVEIIITDQGEGFDPEDIENPVDDKNLLKEVGRGFFIVKSLMDKVVTDKLETGTRVSITKNF
jgi:serine/threonine-protein kinase RsbW